MKFFSAIFCFLFFASANNAYAINKFFGKGYCVVRHPVEAIFSPRTSCESQHIIQQQSDGENDLNTIWINSTLHDYLDRSSCKPWENQRPAFAPFSDHNIEHAYMIGVWANGYHFFIYNHHGKGKMTLLEWDGATHLLYLLTSISNLPQKEFGYIAYQIERAKKGQETQFIDAFIGIFVDIFEVSVGAIYSAVGMVVGTVLNPIDTIRNIPSLITLSISGIFNAIWFLIKNVIALFSFNAIGSCGAYS